MNSAFTVQKDLNKILKLERKRKINKAVGIILGSVAVPSIIAGGYLISIGSTIGGRRTHDFVRPIGIIIAGSGVIYGRISIPFWVYSKKRKKERDKLIEMYDKKLLE